ncbi:MAG: purine-nucleoside phosphorylase [Saprospiraceae bacterium]|nr:purine-nucleoside phosphorylase [Candidatus Vicinibacter affinis]MBP6172754.1 purine-nucleoside phosphorylase [Saprospiraceae bacterium]MBK6573424.1 purine-nucleoside phosphorylase [Candidatus Vicinibacter affinis]MBK6822101.1 purine-nucleoside phosphorylase [Candidatus Vicinibacter affinis]MBK7302103.1 purine-nucleoside phosphorylase [Candidatus Vicinibacter affinis]
MSVSLFDEIQQSSVFIKERFSTIPKHVIVLGTGLGNLVNRLEVIKEISYKVIPNFVPTTVESHSGKLILAKWKGVELLLLSGRLHYYEGYSIQEVTYPIRVLHELGVNRIWLTNASGSVNPHLNAGEIVFIDDHINFHPENPLRGAYDPRLGIRFPDMSSTYAPEELAIAKRSCEKLKIEFKKGIYFGLQGPSLETPAEYRMIKLLGADIVGMSTVPEVIVAHQCGMKILGASIVSNSSPETGLHEVTTLESVIETIRNSSEKLFDVFEQMLHEKT